MDHAHIIGKYGIALSMKGAGKRGLPTARHSGKDHCAARRSDSAAMHWQRTALVKKRPERGPEEKKPYCVPVGVRRWINDYLVATRN